MKPLVSIVIRTFNEEKHIGKLLHEVQNQNTNFDYETIIVDSGSTDSTIDIVKQHLVTVEQINPKNFSFGYSLNRGIDLAQGEYTVITSAHCYPVDKLWLQNIIQPFKDKKVGLVYGKQIGNEKTRYSEHQIFAKWFPDHDMDDCTLSFCNNANSAIRNDLWRVCPFDETLTGLEDIDWGKKIQSRGYRICYRTDAGVYHIHVESSKQIFRRYYREALAYKAIFLNVKFGLYDFIKLLSMNLVGDYIHALTEGKFLRNIFDIPLFRFLQFWGTYQAHRYSMPISKEMRRRLYYPKRPSIFSLEAKEKKKTSHKPKFVDISKPLTETLSVWPGSQPFKIEKVKNYERDGVNESHFSMNIHTGTHIDAPYHFVRNGKKIHEIPLDQMIGRAFVIECMKCRAIDRHHLDSFKFPKGVSKLILKTPNSYRPDQCDQFFKDFAHITPDAAHWIVEKGFHLIGIDAPSIQGFFDDDNRTHEVLLENEVVILEGLNLSTVSSGLYQLIALPLNLSNTEGAPVRAILKREEIKL